MNESTVTIEKVLEIIDVLNQWQLSTKNIFSDIEALPEKKIGMLEKFIRKVKTIPLAIIRNQFKKHGKFEGFYLKKVDRCKISEPIQAYQRAFSEYISPTEYEKLLHLSKNDLFKIFEINYKAQKGVSTQEAREAFEKLAKPFLMKSSEEWIIQKK